MAAASQKKGSRALVSVVVGDIHIQVDSVALDEVEDMGAKLVAISEKLRRKHPQLRSIVECVPGGTMATSYVDDDWCDDGRKGRVGFTA